MPLADSQEKHFLRFLVSKSRFGRSMSHQLIYPSVRKHLRCAATPREVKEQPCTRCCTILKVSAWRLRATWTRAFECNMSGTTASSLADSIVEIYASVKHTPFLGFSFTFFPLPQLFVYVVKMFHKNSVVLCATWENNECTQSFLLTRNLDEI